MLTRQTHPGLALRPKTTLQRLGFATDVFLLFFTLIPRHRHDWRICRLRGESRCIIYEFASSLYEIVVTHLQNGHGSRLGASSGCRSAWSSHTPRRFDIDDSRMIPFGPFECLFVSRHPIKTQPQVVESAAHSHDPHFWFSLLSACEPRVGTSNHSMERTADKRLGTRQRHWSAVSHLSRLLMTASSGFSPLHLALRVASAGLLSLGVRRLTRPL